MSEATLRPTTTSEAADNLIADALRAEAWAGEPFLHPDESPDEVLAPGTARRDALDDALAGMLTELIAANQRELEEEENGNGALAEAELAEPDDEDEQEEPLDDDGDEDEDEEPGFAGEDPG